MQVIVQDLATQYSRLGRGPVVLVLHGWADSSESWRSVAKRLAAGYEVVLLDLPGFGGTEAPKVAWGLTEYAQFIQAFLLKTSLKPYAIVGHSNGGAIAIRGVGQGLLQAKKLLLVASAGVRGTSSRKGLYLMAKVGKVIAYPLPKRVKQQMRERLYHRAGSDMLVAEHMQESFKRVVRDDVRADAAYISTPTLLVYGEKDTETPFKLGLQLQDAIEGSSFQLIPDVGHFVQVEAEAKLIELAEDFLRA